jgi:hypothetical protein
MEMRIFVKVALKVAVGKEGGGNHFLFGMNAAEREQRGYGDMVGWG